MTCQMTLPYVAAIAGAILLCASFDTYFTTSLVRVSEHFSAGLKGAPPAKRLVIFLADGLRADKCLELDEERQPRMPFLRSVIQEEGVWGLSFGRAPTETRPSHITIIAGIHEDPSGILKGWKRNPVAFDSVFNRSIHTWCWGNADILQLFLHGTIEDRVTVRGYSQDIEESAEFYPQRLDRWVFFDVAQMFENAHSDSTLDSALRQDGIILYLHLLGIDSAGHIFAAESTVYHENIKVIDQGMKSMVSLMNEFYKDQQTAYIMTSDHGMTLEGSHGGDLPVERITPFIAWGAGLRGPITASISKATAVLNDQETACSNDYACTFPTPMDVSHWNLSRYERHDMEQTDIAPLISSLLGLAIPANSVGMLHTGLLNMSEHDRAASMLANANQMVELLKAQKMRVQRHILSSLFAWPYSNAAIADVHNLLNKAKIALMQGDYSASRRFSTDLMTAAKAGLHYYSAYDQPLLRACVTLSFLGLIAYALTTLLSVDGGTKDQLGRQPLHHETQVASQRGAWRWREAWISAFFVIQLMILSLLTVQSPPLLYYLYVLLPIWLWKPVVDRAIQERGRLMKVLACNWKEALSTIIIVGTSLVFLVASFFHREMIAAGLAVPALMPWWLRRTSNGSSVHLPVRIRVFWFAACCLLACFAVHPIARRSTNYTLVLLSACCISGITYWKARNFSCTILKLQAVIALLAGGAVFWTSQELTQGHDSPLATRVFCWSLLGSTLLLPTKTPTRPAEHRLASMAAALTTLYITLSFSHEALLSVVLTTLVTAWHLIESSLARCLVGSAEDPEDIRRSSTSSDHSQSPLPSSACVNFRLSMLFICLLAAAFFAVNDVSSIISVDHTSVKCYLTVFAAGITRCLTLIKVVTPMLLVACTFGLVVRDEQDSTGRNSQPWFAYFLVMTSFMSLYFFYFVTNEGSWLNMGLSLSRYVTALLLPFAMSIYLRLGLFFSSASLGS